MTAPTSPGVVPADALLIAQTIAYQTNDISLETEQDLTHRIYAAIIADRANRPSLTEVEREQVRREERDRLYRKANADYIEAEERGDAIAQDAHSAAAYWLGLNDGKSVDDRAVALRRALADRSEPRQEKEGDCV